MKNIFLTISSLLLFVSAYSQELRQVKFSGATTVSFFSFVTDQGVIINVSEDGKVLEWGIEMDRRRYNYYPGKLEPYMGRVDYYGQESDSVLRGKIKSIGTCQLNYYGAFDTKEKIGKLKMIGHSALDYYDSYENQLFKGKLKYAGTVLFSYYSSFENEAFRGKLKTIANTTITYYSSFDDKLIKGKLKSIGSFKYEWHTSNASYGYQGGLKSGSFTQNINGIVYIIM